MSDVAAVVSAIASLFTIAGSYYVWRTRQLRREEVQQWGMQCIEVLQTSVLVFQTMCHECGQDDLLECQKLKIRSSVLCEQGRLFFKNKNSGAHGQPKRPAYRGLRPIILDRLVVNSQLLDRIAKGERANMDSIARVAEDNLKHFVSLIQDEVGRGRTASPDTNLGGQSINVERLIADDIKRVAIAYLHNKDANYRA